MAENTIYFISASVGQKDLPLCSPGLLADWFLCDCWIPSSLFFRSSNGKRVSTASSPWPQDSPSEGLPDCSVHPGDSFDLKISRFGTWLHLQSPFTFAVFCWLEAFTEGREGITGAVTLLGVTLVCVWVMGCETGSHYPPYIPFICSVLIYTQNDGIANWYLCEQQMTTWLIWLQFFSS